jgi:sugar O-acyltransferase (sialic acid O-acetyltransferase NeuD family)
MSAERAAKLVLIGGGGHALVVAECARRAGVEVAGFYDDDPRAVCGAKLGLAHMGKLEEGARSPWGQRILAVGDLARRRGLIGMAEARMMASVCAAPIAEEGKTVIGRGVLVAVGAIVQPLARIGDHAIINTGAIIEHECEIGENAHIAPGAVLGGRVTVGADTLVGLGSRVLPNVKIGCGCVVGAGAVVTEDVADGATVAGVPAKAI